MEKKRPHRIVICNCNEKVKRIVEELQVGTDNTTIEIVLIIQDETLWENNKDWHPELKNQDRFKTITGCPTDRQVLEQAGIGEAGSAIILADPNHDISADSLSTLTAMAIEIQNPHVHTVMELILSINRAHLEKREVNEVVCIGETAEKLIAQSCITPGIIRIFENLLTTQKGTPQIFIENVPESLHNMSFRKISYRAIKSGSPFIIMGYIKNKIKKEEQVIHRTFVINPILEGKPGKDALLSHGDQLVVISHEASDLTSI